MDPKLKIIGFGSHGDVHQPENHENDCFFGFSQSEFERLLDQNEAE